VSSASLRFPQRFGSSLNPHCHFQVLALHGVFSEDEGSGQVRFHEATGLTPEDWHTLARTVQRRLQRRRPTVGTALRSRQQDQDPAVIAHAWKCQHRLYKLYHRLAAKKPKQVAATAVAREMVGFLWAVLHALDITELQHSEDALAA